MCAAAGHVSRRGLVRHQPRPLPRARARPVRARPPLHRGRGARRQPQLLHQEHQHGGGAGPPLLPGRHPHQRRQVRRHRPRGRDRHQGGDGGRHGAGLGPVQAVQDQRGSGEQLGADMWPGSICIILFCFRLFALFYILFNLSFHIIIETYPYSSRSAWR